MNRHLASSARESARLMPALAFAGWLLVACGGHRSAAPTTPTTTPPVSTATTTSATSPVAATTTSPTTATTVLPGPPGTAVLAGFSPTDATFINDLDGWAIGSHPCAQSACTTIVRTGDGGRIWVTIPAPPAKLTGLRFASAIVGYAFDEASGHYTINTATLYTTVDGGATWRPIDDDTFDVGSVEPGPTGVYAVTGYGAKPNHLLKITPTGVTYLPGSDQMFSGSPSPAVHRPYAHATVSPDPHGTSHGTLAAYNARPPARRLALDKSDWK